MTTGSFRTTVRRWLAGAVLRLAAAAAPAATLALDPQAGQVWLDGAGQAWLERDGKATIDAVAGASVLPWAPTRPGTIYPLHSGAALWFRFELAEPDDNDRWYLEVPYPGVDRVTLYTRAPDGSWLHQTAGDLLPVASWPLPHRHPLLPLALEPGAPRQFFLRVENTHNFGAPLVFTSERQLLRQEQRAALGLGVYFGLAGLSMVLALAAAAWLRDVAFARFALFVPVVALAQAALTGVAGLHLWPHWPWWADLASFSLPVAAMGLLLWFLSALVSLPQRSRRLHWLVTLLALQCCAAAVAIMVVDRAWRVQILQASLLLGIAAGCAVVVWTWRRGQQHAVLLLVALVPLAVGAAVPLARTAGLLPMSFWTLHSLQVAIAIELPLLLTLLMMRRQAHRETTRRLLGLDRTDPATGLINAQVFEQRLQRLIERSGRLRHQSLVMLVDIVNVEQVRRDWDRHAAEELPLRVAARLLETAREIDTVARLGPHRFGLLIEGPVAPAEISAHGPRIVARCLMPFEGRPPGWVAQVRVAQGLVPGGDDAGQLVARLDAVLASVPEDSKRAVFTLR